MMPSGEQDLVNITCFRVQRCVGTSRVVFKLKDKEADASSQTILNTTVTSY